MTDTPEQPTTRLDQIEAILLQTNISLNRVAQQQELNTQAITELTDNTNRVLARSAVLDDVLLELHESSERHQMNFERHQQNFERHYQNFERHYQNFERHQQNFERHQQNFERHQQNFERHQENFENSQRSIEAALNRLEAMVLQIIRRFE